MRRRWAWAIVVVVLAAHPAAQRERDAADDYAFAANDAGVFQVELKREGTAFTFDWPLKADRAWDTALLGIDVQADAVMNAAYLEVSAPNRDRQYLAPGDAGRRWLNLSTLRGLVNGGQLVRVAMSNVQVAPGRATLRVFANVPDLSKPMLVLAPHPDDAEIAAFGLYAFRSATVVTVTAGNAGAPTYESVFDEPGDLYLFKGRIRVIDSITVPWQGGVPPERAFNMGYFDARLADMHGQRDAVVPEMYRANDDINVYRRENIGSLLPKRPRVSTWRHLVDDTLEVLKKVKPAIVVAPHPQLDTHRDHQFTTVALAEAMQRWRNETTLLLYTNHADQNRYPYGPAGTLMSLPPVPRGARVALDRVYSHPVDRHLQRLKLFALESMHDLRFTPTRQYQLARSDDRALSWEKAGPEPDVTYLRRGPRSNEMFYAYTRESFAAMIKEFLAQRGKM